MNRSLFGALALVSLVSSPSFALTPADTAVIQQQLSIAQQALGNISAILANANQNQPYVGHAASRYRYDPNVCKSGVFKTDTVSQELPGESNESLKQVAINDAHANCVRGTGASSPCNNVALVTYSPDPANVFDKTMMGCIVTVYIKP
jgi:hypothetical protein